MLLIKGYLAQLYILYIYKYIINANRETAGTRLGITQKSKKKLKKRNYIIGIEICKSKRHANRV